MPKTKIKSIAGRIRQARLVARLSQTDVAKQLHVTRQAVSNWENGGMLPSLVDFAKLAEIYGVTSDFMLFGLVTIPVDMLDQIPNGECEYLDKARAQYKTILKLLARKGHDSGFKALE
jgi:transcriptional regulator with XRE-family HTH domain